MKPQPLLHISEGMEEQVLRSSSDLQVQEQRYASMFSSVECGC